MNEDIGVNELRRLKSEAKMWKAAALAAQASMKRVLKNQNTIAPQIQQAIRTLKEQVFQARAERDEMVKALSLCEAELDELRNKLEASNGG